MYRLILNHWVQKLTVTIEGLAGQHIECAARSRTDRRTDVLFQCELKISPRRLELLGRSRNRIEDEERNEKKKKKKKKRMN